MAKKKFYKVIFLHRDDVIEIYAQHVFQSDIFGFIEVGELIFGERSQLLVDPAEEKLRTEFDGVKRTFIPMNSVLRIDEVEQPGEPKLLAAKSSVASFPNKKGPGRDG